MLRTLQPLHIFRKDVVHLWPEILVVLILFSVFGYVAPSGWAGSPYLGVAQLVSLLLDVLLPISWLVLISRLVHDEMLVGDRQFWTSRPYHWASLLASKVLFLLVFIYLPFFLMQAVLIKHAGLYPTTAIPALLHNLLLLTVVLIVPITALAAVTSTFARLLLSFLGSILYLLVVGLFIGWIVWEKMVPPALTPILITLLILLPAVALVFQYATRRTSIARIILAATPLLLVLLTFVVPYSALIRTGYPVVSGISDPKLTDTFPDQLKPKAPAPGNLLTFRKEAQVQMPFAVSGVDKDSAYVVKGVQATITAPGIHWTSPYTSEAGREIVAGSPFSAVLIHVPLDIFNKLGPLPADVHLSIVTDHLKLDPPATWKADGGSFHVPAHGICTFADNEAASPLTGQAPDLNCRYALKLPQLTFVSASVSPQTCGGGNKFPATANIGSTNMSLSFDPVVSQGVAFRTGDPDPKHHYVVCPGTPLVFLQAKDAGKARFELDLKQVVLQNYAEHRQLQQNAAE